MDTSGRTDRVLARESDEGIGSGTVASSQLDDSDSEFDVVVSVVLVVVDGRLLAHSTVS